MTDEENKIVMRLKDLEMRVDSERAPIVSKDFMLFDAINLLENRQEREKLTQWLKEIVAKNNKKDV